MWCRGDAEQVLRAQLYIFDVDVTYIPVVTELGLNLPPGRAEQMSLVG